MKQATANHSAAAPKPVKAPSQAREALKIFIRNKSAVLGTLIFLAILAITLIGPYFMEGDPFDVAGIPMTKPGHENNWLGTAYLGRDVWAGLVHGGRATLAVGFVAAMLSVFIGVLFGALSGFYGGWVDEGLMRSEEHTSEL